MSLIALGTLILLLLNKGRLMKYIIHLVLLFFLIFQLASIFYFVITLEPISSAIFALEFEQISIVASNYVKFEWYFLLLLLPIFIYLLLYRLLKSSTRIQKAVIVFYLPFLFFPFTGFQLSSSKDNYNVDSLIENKIYYFISGIITNNQTRNNIDEIQAIKIYQKTEDSKKFFNENYPLLHSFDDINTLAPYFDLKETPPNIVLIVVESLSSSYSGKNANEMSFTPFLDSLSEYSLYFENMLATAERSFAVLPSIISSLPHGKKGFTEMKNNYPSHTSLSKWLFKNNYTGAFFFGGYARFDQMDLYMYHEGFHEIFERKEFNYKGTGYQTSIDNVPFGVGDKQLFRTHKRITDSLNRASPFFDVMLTLSMHYPFIIEDQERYKQLAKKRIENASRVPVNVKNKLLKYTQQLSTVIYTDDALKEYFKQQEKSKHYNNTIYLIVGDHMMGDIPQLSPIEKYRIPLIIYSPLLKKHARFRGVNTHLDIAPSLMKLIGEHYSFKMPQGVSWLGTTFDTSRKYHNDRKLLFMRNGRTCQDLLVNDILLSDEKLYKVGKHLSVSPINNSDKLKELIRIKDSYERIHKEVVVKNEMIPFVPKPIALEESMKYIKYNDNEEYIVMYEKTLEKDYNNFQLELSLFLEKGWEKGIYDEFSMLTFNYGNEKESKLWEVVDYQINELSFTEERKIVYNIENSVNFQLKKGDKIKLLIWNKESKNKNYTLLIKHLKFSGE